MKVGSIIFKTLLSVIFKINSKQPWMKKILYWINQYLKAYVISKLILENVYFPEENLNAQLD